MRELTQIELDEVSGGDAKEKAKDAALKVGGAIIGFANWFYENY